VKTNSELLAYTGPKDLLYGLERQRRYVLQVESGPFGCPHCGTQQAKWEIHGVDVDGYDLGKTHGDEGKCKGCNRPVRYYVTLMGGMGLSTIPDPSLAEQG
jgi:hypothetical protein